MRVRRIRGRSQGFSLLEVLVSLLIVSLGLLGLSKMQAAALSNTQIARARSLIALQTASLAESMHGNHFWSAGTAPASVTATGLTVTDASNILNATVDCSPTAKSTCTSAQLAAYDFQAWVAALNGRFPGYTAAVQCSITVTTPSCLISVTWTEKYIAINRSTTAAQGAVQTSSPLQFSLYVKP